MKLTLLIALFLLFPATPIPPATTLVSYSADITAGGEWRENWQYVEDQQGRVVGVK